METVAEAWMNQCEIRGFDKGKLLGVAEGKVETFLRPARLRFDTIPDARVAQIHAIDQDNLDVWIDELILDENLDAVFAMTAIH